MPQLDLSTFFSESFLFILVFFLLYILSLLGILPNILSIFLLRKFYLNALVQQYLSTQIFYNKIIFWVSFLTLSWFSNYSTKITSQLSNKLMLNSSFYILSLNLIFNRFFFFSFNSSLSFFYNFSN